MTNRKPFARIAITLPEETLAAADALAARHDRSRSWIVAEAVRQYAAAALHAPAEAAPASLGPSRREQLSRDAALSPEAPVLAAAEVTPVGPELVPPAEPLAFAQVDDFLDWQRARELGS
ncbi:MAG: ribbon-helix-helix protein, CopG family [Gemmatimonadetes bacterium]|nr:ribbon-helix-helix protein, CopG family [Gemmatimonadota bacterium]